MRKIVHIEKPIKENLDFQWLQLHLRKYEISDETDDNEKLTTTVKNAIKNILTWEKEIIAKVKK